MVLGQPGGTRVSFGIGALLNAAFVSNVAHTQVLFALPSGLNHWAIALAAGAIHVLQMLLHEVGHAIGRARAGLHSTRIHVGLYCYEEGVAPQEPRQDLVHSLGGPAADAVMAIAAGSLYLAARQLGLGSAVTFLAGFATVRAALGLVELFPAFPLDGAQALRAGCMESGLDRLAATHRVVRLGVRAAIATALAGGAGLALLGAGPVLMSIWSVASVFAAIAVHLLGQGETSSVLAALGSSDETGAGTTATAEPPT